jgi:hypothetical protein
MKDFAKSIVCNTKAEAEKVGNSYQYAGSIPIEKIPDNWRPEFPKAGYIVYYAPNKAKWFATESEAKRFAESQDKAQKTGNSRVGNSDESYILSSYENKLKEYIAKSDKEGLKTLIRSAEAKYKETKKASENFYKEYKDADDASKKYWKIGGDAMAALNEIK